MLGAIIGDIVGSVYEFNNIKTKAFKFWGQNCRFTDDTVMTCAVYKAITEYKQSNGTGNAHKLLVENMQQLGRMYPNCGYGDMFNKWIQEDNPQPYNSFGNGCAMRVSAAGWLGESMEEVTDFATFSAEVTHNHPQGIKGAIAVAQGIFLARLGVAMEQIKMHLSQYYDLDFTLSDIREAYSFNETCQGTVPQAIVAFLEATDFEDAVRNAISIGGDSDTLAAITGSLAEAYFEIPQDMRETAMTYLDSNLQNILKTL